MATQNEFFHPILAEIQDPFEMKKKYEEELARDPDYRRIFRNGYIYHGVHPFFMWYWGQNGRHHLGKVIVVGPENPQTTERTGWESAPATADVLGTRESI